MYMCVCVYVCILMFMMLIDVYIYKQGIDKHLTFNGLCCVV